VVQALFGGLFFDFVYATCYTCQVNNLLAQQLTADIKNDCVYCIINAVGHAVVAKISIIDFAIAWQTKIPDLQASCLAFDADSVYVVGTQSAVGDFLLSRINATAGTAEWARSIRYSGNTDTEPNWTTNASVAVGHDSLAVTLFTETNLDVRRTVSVTLQYPVTGDLHGDLDHMTISPGQLGSTGTWLRITPVPANVQYQDVGISWSSKTLPAEPYRQSIKNGHSKFSLTDRAWHNVLYGCELEPPYEITCTGRTFYHSNNIYVLGSITDKPTGTNADENIFVKYTAEGDIAWAKDWTDIIGEPCNIFNTASLIDRDLIYWTGHAPASDRGHVIVCDLEGNLAKSWSMDHCCLTDLAVVDSAVYVIGSVKDIPILAQAGAWAVQVPDHDSFVSIAVDPIWIMVLAHCNNKPRLICITHAGIHTRAFEIDADTF